jgi:peptidoglycan/xylan/chitin deacetylase (PgdA/CDA1 family)
MILKHTGIHLRSGAFFLSLAILILFSGCLTINRTKEATHIPDKIVVFSFDDGPNAHADTTVRLLEVLGKYEICALFALLGENVDFNPELAKRIHDEGHIIINHGYSDKWVVLMGTEEFTRNLIRGEQSINSALGKDLYPRLYRPQGGIYTLIQQKIWREMGYTLIPGTARAYDAIEKREERKKIIKKIVGLVAKQGGGIILLHDARDSHTRMEKYLVTEPEGEFDRSWIPGMVEEIIIILQKQGYRLKGFDTAAILGIKLSE